MQYCSSFPEGPVVSLFVAFRTLSKGTRDYSELLSDTWGDEGRDIYVHVSAHVSARVPQGKP